MNYPHEPYLVKHNFHTYRFWLTLVNEDHKDGPQNVRAPSLTSVEKLCSGEDPTVSIAASEHCEAIIPDWNEEPSVEFLSGAVFILGQ